ERLGAVQEPRAGGLARARPGRLPEPRVGQARPVEEGAVHGIGEWIIERQAPGPRQERLLRRHPIARVPVPLEETLREPPHVAQVVEELDDPQGAADLVPPEPGGGKLLLEVPGQVEGIDAIEHAEVVGLAPDDLLAAAADRQRQPPELQVDVGLAELVVELERRALTPAEPAQLELPAPEPLEARRRAEPDPGGIIEVVHSPVRPSVDVLLLHEARRDVVGAERHEDDEPRVAAPHRPPATSPGPGRATSPASAGARRPARAGRSGCRPWSCR